MFHKWICDMPAGRPTDYTQELANEICDAIATESLSLKKLCDLNSHWPEPRSIYRWLNRYPEFSQMYASAKRSQVTPLVDEILEISDDSRNDTYLDEDDNILTDHDHINRTRLRVDTRKWIAAKLVPRLYGDNSGMRELYEEIAELKRELANKEIKHGKAESSEAE